MIFGGLVKQSLVDYPGEVAAVLFTRGCNLFCPFCHNAHLLHTGDRGQAPIALEEVMAFLEERRSFLDAVVISGGEPTINKELPEVIHRIKSSGYLVKLDSNGTNPAMLDNLLDQELLDYVAMDIKAPLEYKNYLQACGKLTAKKFLAIRNSIHILQRASIKVEFRTTVVPALHSPEDIVSIARYIKGAKKYTLQQFDPRSTLDPHYAAVVPYTKEQMEEIARNCSQYIDKLRVVNL